MSKTETMPEAATDHGPLSPTGVKILKFAVVAMGVMIIAGLVLIVGRIIYLASKPKAARPAAAAYAPQSSVRLPPAARPKHLSLNGNQLSVLYEGENGAGVIVIDLTSGKTISTITFEAGAAAPSGQSK